MLKLYTRESCPFCLSLINELDKKDISYEKLDVSLEENLKQLQNLNVGEAVPTLEMQKDNFKGIIVGMDLEKIELVLNLFEKNSYEEPVEILGGIPTDQYGNPYCPALGANWKMKDMPECCSDSNALCRGCYNSKTKKYKCYTYRG